MGGRAGDHRPNPKSFWSHTKDLFIMPAHDTYTESLYTTSDFAYEQITRKAQQMGFDTFYSSQRVLLLAPTEKQRSPRLILNTQPGASVAILEHYKQHNESGIKSLRKHEENTTPNAAELLIKQAEVLSKAGSGGALPTYQFERCVGHFNGKHVRFDSILDPGPRPGLVQVIIERFTGLGDQNGVYLVVHVEDSEPGASLAHFATAVVRELTSSIAATFRPSTRDFEGALRKLHPNFPWEQWSLMPRPEGLRTVFGPLNLNGVVMPMVRRGSSSQVVDTPDAYLDPERRKK